MGVCNGDPNQGLKPAGDGRRPEENPAEATNWLLGSQAR